MCKKKEIAPLRIIITALILFFLLKAAVIDLKRIDGRSMLPGLKPGEFVLINRLAYGLVLPFTGFYLWQWRTPGIGEVVAVKHPLEPKIIIKRCLGVAGDKLVITENFLIIHSGTIPAGRNNLQQTLQFTRVPDDKILIIGDNYSDSIDSRNFGFVSNSRVLGKVLKL